MKRRGFLAFMGGAAVAGPGMAKQAATQTLADLSLAPVVGDLVPTGDSIGGSIGGSRDWQVRELAQLVGRSAAQHAFNQSRVEVTRLDPDLASYRSISLSAKIMIQRERTYWREFERNRTWLEKAIAGWFD